jgi:hypothetical protein
LATGFGLINGNAIFTAKRISDKTSTFEEQLMETFGSKLFHIRVRDAEASAETINRYVFMTYT